MQPNLHLYEDVLSNVSQQIELPALPRLIFVAHGVATIGARALKDGEAWSGEDAVALAPGGSGVTLWRFELSAGDGAALAGPASRRKLTARLETMPQGRLLLRGDSVAFPPGGCAFLHRHQGPGIRCLYEGGIRIDTQGRSTCYGPGGAWYESGPEPVFAQAADRPTRFVRVMVLPVSCLGKSSLEYVNEDDRAKPKSQVYKIFADLPLAWAG